MLNKDHSAQEMAHRANVAKLRQLQRDAALKAAELDAASVSSAYWHGVEAGLRRAQTVIEGRG